MSVHKISVKDIYKIFPNNTIMDSIPLIKVELMIELNFETFGQVWYTDENGRPWIKEFRGNAWTKQLLMKDNRSIGFSVFINNQFQEEGRYVTLTKKIDNVLADQKIFMIDKEKIFDGWFKMGS
ncbi:MAG: hypothetical protein K9G06_04070 [Chitinophagaceae bacterium]|jgi:hypothetical protein|nr:hypothetical protein [Chitinophagaceae bacterium]